MNTQRGFTLIELMIVVAIIAILAAIAMLAYQNYMARAQVSEAFSLSADARQGIVIYHAQTGDYPSGNTEVGISEPSSIVGRYVESVTIGNGNGEISILLGNDASALISGQTLTMELIHEAGSLRWDCAGLEPRYLPSACR